MDHEKIALLLDQASERYNSAGYREAIDLWNQVLALEPDNQKAREGIRMASLLVAESKGARASAAPGSAPGQDQIKARIEAGLRRVRELVDSGQQDAALRGCELLKQLDPESEEVKALVAEVEGNASPEPALDELLDEPIPLEDSGDIETILNEARQALADGRNRDATQAASRVLQLDPSHMEACGILSRAADEDMDGGEVPIDGVDTGEVPAAGFEEGSLSLDDPEPEPQPEGPPSPAEESPEVIDTAKAAPGDRVSDLLSEGRAAFDDGRAQDAIEIWSRVFVLDQNNSEAGLLIDKAKGLIEEKAREIDDLFYKGIDLQDSGDLEAALELFLKVKSLSPTHPEVGLRIDEINARLSGDAPAIGLDMERAREIEQLQQEESEPEQYFDGGTVPLASTQEFPSVEKPERSEQRPAAERKQEGPSSSPAGSGRALKIAAGVLIFAGAGTAAWLWFGTDSGSMQEAEATVAVTPRPRPAKVDVEPGRQEPVPSSPAAGATSPDSSITVLQGGVSPTPARPPVAEGSYADRAKAADLVREGRNLFQQEQWAASIRAFRTAAELDPMGFDAQDKLDKAMASLEREAHLEREMEVSTRYFTEGDYASALHKFYRIQLDYPEIREMSRYIRNAWFNWGVMLLQAGAVEEAAEKFTEVLDISPRDKEAVRAHEVAMRYRGKTRDSFFDSFSMSLALRSLDRN